MIAEMQSEEICPACGQGSPVAAVRQGRGMFYGMEMHLVEIAFRCHACGHEWGFNPDQKWLEDK